MYKVANVKLSIKSQPLFLDIVFNKLKQQQIECTKHNNFIVIKKKFTYGIYKEKNGITHINVTKIPDVSYIASAFDELKWLTDFELISYQIDNIIATANLKKRLNLKDIAEKNSFTKIKYNNQIFPGLFIKSKQGTIILFHSGKIVIVGSKSKADIECLILKICANI